MLGYRVALGSRRRGREPQTVCNTNDTHCDFTVPVRTGRVYLSAYNAAGESSATEVILLERKGEVALSPTRGAELWHSHGCGSGARMLSPALTLAAYSLTGQPLAGLWAVPAGDRSLWVHWEAAPVPVVAYVLEWQPVSSEPGHCSACWQLERNGTTTTTLIRGKLGAAGCPSPPTGLCGAVLCLHPGLTAQSLH